MVHLHIYNRFFAQVDVTIWRMEIFGVTFGRLQLALIVLYLISSKHVETDVR
jgi:hypothetical protein